MTPAATGFSYPSPFAAGPVPFTIVTGAMIRGKSTGTLPKDIVAEPLVGVRLWRPTPAMDGTDTSWRLGSLAAAHYWQKNETASCPGYTGDDPAPHVGCGCGLWALKPDDPFLYRALGMYGRMYGRSTGLIVGRVLLWGKVIEHEYGWRAQHARPLDLAWAGARDPRTAFAFREVLEAQEKAISRLASFYDVPVVTLESLLPLWPWNSRPPVKGQNTLGWAMEETR